MKKLDSDYVARYEYACSLIAKFFERELSINASSKDDHLFATNSVPQILFTSDYSKLIDPLVRKQIEDHLGRLDKDEGNFIIARVHGVIIDFYSILGEEFVNELISNTAHGIAAAGGVGDDESLKQVKNTLNKHKELLVFIMGNKIYQHEFIARKLKPALNPAAAVG